MTTLPSIACESAATVAQTAQAGTHVKARLRRTLLDARNAIDSTERSRRDAVLALHLQDWLQQHPVDLLGVYWPIRGEPDLREFYDRISATGVRLALPLVVGRELPLQFSAWVPGAPLVTDRAHGAAPLPRVDDLAPVLEPARERLLEVDGDAALEARDGWVDVVGRWRADEDRIELVRVESRLPTRRRLGAGETREVGRARLVDVAHDRDLDAVPEQCLDVAPRDRARADESEPHAFSSSGRRTKNWYCTPPLVSGVVQIICPLSEG